MVGKFMDKCPAKLILLSLCFQGRTLVPALGQAVVPADGRVGLPMNAPAAVTAANVPATPPPVNISSYVLVAGPYSL
jgi:hypothetical protein